MNTPTANDKATRSVCQQIGQNQAHRLKTTHLVPLQAPHERGQSVHGQDRVSSRRALPGKVSKQPQRLLQHLQKIKMG